MGVFSLRQRNGKTALIDPGTPHAPLRKRRIFSDVFLPVVRNSSGGRCRWWCKFFWSFCLLKFLLVDVFLRLQYYCSGSYSSRFFLIYSYDVLFQWLAHLVAPYGNVLWAKLEAIQQGYEVLGYIGKRQVIQRWEETFEDREFLNFLAETGGFIEIDDE